MREEWMAPGLAAQHGNIGNLCNITFIYLLCIYLSIYIYIYLYVYMYTYIYIYTFIYVFMHLLSYAYINSWNERTATQYNTNT